MFFEFCNIPLDFCLRFFLLLIWLSDRFSYICVFALFSGIFLKLADLAKSATRLHGIMVLEFVTCSFHRCFHDSTLFTIMVLA